MRSLPRWFIPGLLLSLFACGPAAGAPTTPERDGAGGVPAASAPAPSSGGAAPTASEALPPAALRRIELPVSTLNAVSTPLWVAADYGLFNEYGLEVEITGMAPATVPQAVSAGSVPLAGAGGGAVSAWVSGATELVFIAGQANKATHKIVGRPEIASMEELRGKTVGSTTAGSTGAIALHEALRRFGLDPDGDVAISYLRDQPSMLTGLLSGAVQGAVLGSPFSERALGEGTRLLADLRQLDVDMLTSAILTTRGQVERDPDLLRRFLMGYVAGIRYARERPADAIESILRGTRDTDRAAAEMAYAVYRDIWTPWPSEAGIQLLIDNLDLPGARTARVADMVDDRLLRELERSGWLAEHLGPP
jgi:ABC-type nitrate/sulfonate/bicarbonate transport system substrate-binding protein